MLRYLRNLVGDPDRADDAFQETFLAAWRSAGTFRGDGPAVACLLAIARNAARRQHRLRAGEPEEHEPLTALAVDAGWGREDEDVTRRLEARELVERGLEALSAGEREILVLRDGEGLSGDEVAELLGITLAAQKSRLHRAHLRFMARMAALGELDEEGGHDGP